MTDIALHVIDGRPRASVIIHAPAKGKLAINGDGPDRLVCGNCSATLAQGADQGQLVGALVQCPECGAFNEPNA